MENNFEGGLKNEQENNEFPEEANPNNKNFTNQEEAENEQPEEAEEDDDDRLTYTLITLDLGNLIHIFEDNNISFVDMLLLSKEDLIELQLEIFQRNRILNFSKLFTKYAKNYSIREISDFFTFNKQFIFNSSIYDKVFSNNNLYQNEMNNNSNFNMDNNNFEPLNDELNYLNSNTNLYENQSNNFMARSMQINPNNSNFKLNNQPPFGKNNQSQKKYQNINGASKRVKNASTFQNNNINNNNDSNQDNNFHNKLMDFIKKKKNPKLQNNNINIPMTKHNNASKSTKNKNEIDRNGEYQKIIEKIGILENSEMNYELDTKVPLIKNYINNKGDKISSEDINNINNDIDSMVETININNEIGLNNNEVNERQNKIKVIKKK